MWYALQSAIIGYVAYIYLTEISDQKDVLHAVALGAIVAFYATLILSGILNTLRKLIRALRAMLLRPRNLTALRGHKKSDQLVHVSSARRAGPPHLISQVRLGRSTRNRS
jgi:hypothetical protein